jgi:hypothetical protein
VAAEFAIAVPANLLTRAINYLDSLLATKPQKERGSKSVRRESLSAATGNLRVTAPSK